MVIVLLCPVPTYLFSYHSHASDPHPHNFYIDWFTHILPRHIAYLAPKQPRGNTRCPTPSCTGRPQPHITAVDLCYSRVVSVISGGSFFDMLYSVCLQQHMLEITKTSDSTAKLTKTSHCTIHELTKTSNCITHETHQNLQLYNIRDSSKPPTV